MKLKVKKLINWKVWDYFLKLLKIIVLGIILLKFEIVFNLVFRFYRKIKKSNWILYIIKN